MSESENLLGQVAAILNDRELVINIGEEAGVKTGMRFKVLDKPKLVKDPSTKEELGTVTREKIRVKVTEVHPKLSVARSYQTYEVNVGGRGFSFAMGDMYTPPKYVTRVKTLRFKDSGLDYGPLDESGSFVKLGDPVELIPKDAVD